MPASTINKNEVPRFAVKIAGTTCTQEKPMGIESVDVKTSIDGTIGTCRMSFRDGQDFDWSSVKIDDPVEVHFGGSDKPVFVGTITGVRPKLENGKETATFVAKDPLAKLAASYDVEYDFDDMKDSDVARRLIESCGCQAGEIEDTGDVHQYRLKKESPLATIRALCERNPGFHVYSTEGKVHFKKVPLTASPSEIKRDKIIKLDYQNSAARLPEEVVANGWDPIKKQKVTGTATKSDVERVGGGTLSLDQKTTWQSGKPLVLRDRGNLYTDQMCKNAAVQKLTDLSMFAKGTLVVQADAGTVSLGGTFKATEHRQGFQPTGFIHTINYKVELRWAGGTATAECEWKSNTYGDGGGGGGAGGGSSSALASTPVSGGGSSAAGFGSSATGTTTATGAPAGSSPAGVARSAAGGGGGGGLPGGGGGVPAGANALTGGAVPGAAGAVPGAAGGNTSFGSAVSAAADKAGGQMNDALKGAGATLEGAGQKAQGAIEQGISGAKGNLEGAVDKAKKGDLKGAVGSVADAGRSATGAYGEAMKSTAQGFEGAATGVVNGAAGAGKTLVEGVGAGVGAEAKGAASKVLGETGLPSSVTEKAQKEADKAIDKAVDKGVDKGKEEIDKAANKANSEISKASSEIQQGVDEAVGEMNKEIAEGEKKAKSAIDEAIEKIKEELPDVVADQIPDGGSDGGEGG